MMKRRRSPLCILWLFFSSSFFLILFSITKTQGKCRAVQYMQGVKEAASAFEQDQEGETKSQPTSQLLPSQTLMQSS